MFLLVSSIMIRTIFFDVYMSVRPFGHEPQRSMELFFVKTFFTTEKRWDPNTDEKDC